MKVPTYPSFLLYQNSVGTFGKASRILPDIALADNIVIDQCLQFHLGALPCHQCLVHPLFLSPKLLELFLLEPVKPARGPLLHGQLGLAQPFRIMVTILQLCLELPNTFAPVIRVA